MDSEGMLQAFEANPASSTQRISGELNISQSIVVHHLHDLCKSIWSWWIDPHIVTYSYADTCRNIFNTIKTSGYSSLEKYTSHFFRKVYKRYYPWEMSWRLNRTETYWPPNYSGYNSISFLFSCGCSTGGLRAQPLLRHGSHSSIFSPTAWLPVTSRLYNSFTPTCFPWHHNLHSIQPIDSQGYPPISSTGCTCYLHRCISSFDSLAGVNVTTLPKYGKTLYSLYSYTNIILIILIYK